MLTNEQKIEMIKMRAEGFSLKEIGEKFGVSKQRVDQIFSSLLRKGGRVKRRKDYVYPNINKWMYENNVILSEFAKNTGTNVGNLSQKMKGKQDFSMKQIRNILNYTGMTFEEAFYEERKQDGDENV